MQLKNVPRLTIRKDDEDYISHNKLCFDKSVMLKDRHWKLLFVPFQTSCETTYYQLLGKESTKQISGTTPSKHSRRVGFSSSDVTFKV